MGTATEHTLYARRYTAIVDGLSDTNPAASGELLWGAVVQAAHFVAHGQGHDQHPQSRNGIRDIIGRMRLPRAERDKLRAALETAVNNLHGGFYRPDTIDADQHPRHETNARALTDSLWHTTKRVSAKVPRVAVCSNPARPPFNAELRLRHCPTISRQVSFASSVTVSKSGAGRQPPADLRHLSSDTRLTIQAAVRTSRP